MVEGSELGGGGKGGLFSMGEELLMGFQVGLFSAVFELVLLGLVRFIRLISFGVFLSLLSLDVSCYPEAARAEFDFTSNRQLLHMYFPYLFLWGVNC